MNEAFFCIQEFRLDEDWKVSSLFAFLEWAQVALFLLDPVWGWGFRWDAGCGLAGFASRIPLCDGLRNCNTAEHVIRQQLVGLGRLLRDYAREWPHVPRACPRRLAAGRGDGHAAYSCRNGSPTAATECAPQASLPLALLRGLVHCERLIIEVRCLPSPGTGRCGPLSSSLSGPFLLSSSSAPCSSRSNGGRARCATQSAQRNQVKGTDECLSHRSKSPYQACEVLSKSMRRRPKHS